MNKNEATTSNDVSRVALFLGGKQTEKYPQIPEMKTTNLEPNAWPRFAQKQPTRITQL